MGCVASGASGLAKSLLTESGLPVTGKQMAVIIQLAHTGKREVIKEYKGRLVTSDWKVGHLSKAVEIRFGVGAASQRFLCNGREAPQRDTLQEVLQCGSPANLPSQVVLSLEVQGRDQFPQRLPSFVPMKVPLVDADIVRTRGDHSAGFTWILSAEVQARLGLQDAADIRACVSPLHKVTVDTPTRKLLSIPEQARHFGFSFPSPDWKKMAKDEDIEPFDVDWTAPQLHQQASLVRQCLSVGAFMYLDDQCQVVQVNTLQQGVTAVAFEFKEPQLWLPEWTRALWIQNRLQQVTLKVLKDAGVCYFSWVLPDEVLVGEQGQPLAKQPEIPHGAFVYIFHKDPGTEEKEDVCMDRYFAVVGADKARSEDEIAVLGTEENEDICMDRNFAEVGADKARSEDETAVPLPLASLDAQPILSTAELRQDSFNMWERRSDAANTSQGAHPRN